ncbi:MAG TPA: hypothetical protein VNI36_05130 [Candidatus Dormibacteraeota bacterium]|nr:hypothetical protein [Candidatus Dormibacteraeota bacterium]
MLAAPQRQMPPGPYPRFPGLPDASSSGFPPDDTPELPPPDPRVRLKADQKKLRKDADQLLELSKALKQEADHTDQTDVLSVSLIRKAEEIEKLAHHIRNLARAT